jgi:predicted ATP-dependent serine protease
MTKMCKGCNNLKGKELEKYIELIGDGKFICKKCGLLAADKKNLCLPVERLGTFIEKPENNSEKTKKSNKFEKKLVKELKVSELREIIKDEIENFSKAASETEGKKQND